ncbi:hypothetical protein Ga0609869_002232 [Rhodovulum iodosum]|uniref:Antifreeze glycopeptide polyprotein n=1 Tax=Rhodovulum iodosum TaxID=68291 RepID=A0ABV3XU65_9RHOB|nr:hypothetical protein [Rhodovulum robiginosum]RSK38519.1 hypothetical protein EJA01_02000 [Rhodovulum robiginosum]
MRNDAARVVALSLALAGPAGAEAPLSAIDWLSRSVDRAAPRVTDEPRVTDDATPEEIAVRPLDAPDPDAVGLIPAAASGLPRLLWGPTPADEAARLLRAARVDTLPAMQALLVALLLAEIDPPADSTGDGQVLTARLDKLLDLGAVDEAQALVERAGPTASPALFRRWFDISLLTGHEDRACAAMRATPDIAPTFPARIFCLARGGDWMAAALTLGTGRALGFITAEEDALLARFLDPELFEGEPPLPLPARPSPLVFRMREAIGEPLPIATLPRAFARADLRATAGWKTRIEAAERLARTGALAPNVLLGVYTERLPAASGGLWDRVAAVQALDVALLAGDAGAVASALPEAWAAMTRAELEVPFAALYGMRLARVPLSGEAARLARTVGLLSPDYAIIAAGAGTPPFLAAIARGAAPADAPQDALAQAVRAGFADPPPRQGLGPALTQQLSDGRTAEAILAAVDLITDGAHGDVADITQGLALLRLLGLEDDARQAALQLMLLERPG